MQPNQQPAQQSQSPEALPYQVPDYLHMEPAGGNAIKSRRIRPPFKVTAIVAVILIVAASAYFLYLWQKQNSPEALFYKALERSLSISYISRSLDVKAGSVSSTIKLKTDFSRPDSPKSDVLMDLRRVEAGGRITDISTRTIMSGINGYEFSISSANPESTISGLTKNEWYRRSTNLGGVIDFYINESEPLSMLNMSQGLIVMGNFNNEQRKTLIESIKSNDTYHINSTESDENGRLMKYSIKMDYAKINKLNLEVSKLLNVNQQLRIRAAYVKYQDLIIWIDKSSNSIVKMAYNGGNSKDNIDTKRTITYEYPASLTITTPTNPKDPQ